MGIVVARLGRPHGLHGEVTCQVHTDSPGERFRTGTRFLTDPAEAGPLTLRSARLHGVVRLLAFDGVQDRTAAERLRGVRLLLGEIAGEAGEADDGQAAADTQAAAEGWYEHQLVGLRVELTTGEVIGQVSGLEPRPAQDLLEVRLVGGRTAYVPFVHRLVPAVDVAGGRVVVDPPPGLLDLDG
ncbi:MAG TPA: ribosome maturation factor RimM [Dermatophilaceae bacterium]|nr:ribosome maturation factor RimM [Dermatophilaceae bacterium]